MPAASGSVSRLLRLLRGMAVALLVTAGVLLLAEIALRVLAGAPHGHFKLWFSGRLGLYPENARQVNFGQTSWVITTNRWGFRSDDIPREKIPGRWRIAMLGDSITDGFGVENANTYPAFVQQHLRGQGVAADVINGGNGGASIDRELAILRDAITPFQPDIAVLTFVTNDVLWLESVSDADLLGRRADWDTWQRHLMRFLLVYTAVGETAFNQVLRSLSADFARSQDEGPPVLDDNPDRYRIPGGDHFAENVQLFNQIAANGDGRLLQPHLDATVEHQLARYFRAWDAFMAHCREHGIQPVFVYYPAYSQVYDPATPMTIRDRLQARSEQHAVPFLDLTPAMREHGASRVLHLCPRDCVHLNPEGNAVIGQALADFLVQRNLVARR